MSLKLISSHGHYVLLTSALLLQTGCVLPGKRLTDNVYACLGRWIGHVRNATALCQPGFHVCSWRDRRLFRRLNTRIVVKILDDYRECYAMNAAQNYGCKECKNEPTANKMAGFGSNCQYQYMFTNRDSTCLGGGLIHHDNGRTGVPCTFKPGTTTGVVCCRDETTGEQNPTSRVLLAENFLSRTVHLFSPCTGCTYVH